MVEMTVFKALMLGFVSWLLSCNLLGGTVLSQVTNKPLVAAFFCGLIMGDMKDAMIVGSVLQAMYIGAIAVGGIPSMPDINTVQWFAIPAVLVAGGTAETCVALAMALSVINTPLTQIERNIVKVPMVHLQDHCVETGNLKLAMWMPMISQLYNLAVNMFVITGLCLLGTDAVVAIVAMFPDFITGILQVFNGLLPLLGFSMLLMSLVKKNLQLVWLVFGFMLYKVMGLSLISVTIFACGLAYLQFICSGKEEEEA